MAEPANSEVSTTSANPSYFVRLGKLSAKVQERALEQSLGRARKARDATYAAVAQITSTLDLVESARASLGTAGNQIAGAPEQLLQRWTEWKKKREGEGLTESEPDGSKDESGVRIKLFLECNSLFGFEISLSVCKIYRHWLYAPSLDFYLNVCRLILMDWNVCDHSLFLLYSDLHLIFIFQWLFFILTF